MGLAVAGAVLVVLRRDDQEQVELNRVAAISPLVLNEITRAIGRGLDEEEANRIVDMGAFATGVRVLLVDSSGNVIADSARELMGEDIQVPAAVLEKPESPIPPIRTGRKQDASPYITWRASGLPMGSGLTFVSPSGFFEGGLRGPRNASDFGNDIGVVLAVPNENLSSAWQDLLPAIGLSASVALPVAVLLALLVARYITRPVRELTQATHRLADGAVDVHVPDRRQDELGELARAFNLMAQKVGDSQAEMRTMVASVSHDLKTPLTSILGFSQAIRGGTVTGPEAVRAGEVINEEAQRLALRLEDILLMAELDEGGVSLRREPIFLAPLVEGVLARLAGEIGARGQRVERALDGSVIAQVDRARMERVVENLVANATRHAPKGATIDVSLSSEGGDARLEISNPAPGVEAEDVPRLFERFYRMDRTRGRASGSGLGLSIAREIAERHGGRLEGEVSGGVITFRLVLPHPEAPSPSA